MKWSHFFLTCNTNNPLKRNKKSGVICLKETFAAGKPLQSLQSCWILTIETCPGAHIAPLNLVYNTIKYIIVFQTINCDEILSILVIKTCES